MFFDSYCFTVMKVPLKNRNRQVVNGCLRRDDMQNITGERNLQDKKREQKYERKK